MRSKEQADDYRYFPEPDLPPFKADHSFLAEVEGALVELPAARRSRLSRDYSLSEAQLDFITEEKDRADFFERTVALGADPLAAATWLGSDVKKLLNRAGIELAESPLTPKRLAELLVLLGENRIHGKIAKQALEALFAEDKDPIEIIRERGWERIDDAGDVAGFVDEAIATNPQAVGAIRGGDMKAIGFLVGQIMKASSGRADPKVVQRLLRERLAAQVTEDSDANISG